MSRYGYIGDRAYGSEEGTGFSGVTQAEKEYAAGRLSEAELARRMAPGYWRATGGDDDDEDAS